MVDPVGENQQQIPQLHPSWLTDSEREERDWNNLNTEVNRCIALDQRGAQSTQDQEYPGNSVHDDPATPNGDDKSEGEVEEITATIPKLRRVSSHAAKVPMSYRGMVGIK